MVLMNLEANDGKFLTSTDLVITDVTGLSQGYLKTTILCGQNCIAMWIQVDASKPSPDDSNIRAYINPSQWKPDLESLKLFEQAPIFLNSEAWKGLQLNSDVLKPVGATDWVVVPGRSSRMSYTTDVVGPSQQTDTERPWSHEEDNTLLTMRKEKKSLAEIAVILGRKELDVMYRYMDIVPLRYSGGRVGDPGRAGPGMRSVVYVLWVGYDTHPVDVSQRRWRVHGYHEIHCESEMML